MSIDRTLKIKGVLIRHRNVLRRHERIERLKEDQRWSEGDSVLALPKVVHRKSHVGRKEKKAEVAPTVATEAAAPAEQADKS